MTQSDLTISGLEVDLIRITEADLELLRAWRNDSEIRSYMVYREEITPAAQSRWFAELDKDRNFYFLVHHQGAPIGLSHIKNIDWSSRTGEAGLFLVPRSARNSLVAYRATLPGADFTFFELGLHAVTATIRKDNRRAIRFNLSLGHVFSEAAASSETWTCCQTAEAYLAKRSGFEAIFGEFETVYTYR